MAKTGPVNFLKVANVNSLSETKSRVFGFLIKRCLNLRKGTAADIERHWRMSAEEAYNSGIRSCPTEVENLTACRACRDRFGDEVLKRIEGFYQFDRQGTVCNCLEWRNCCVCRLRTWRLDLDPQFAERGIVILGNDSVLVFRHASDLHPSGLRLRRAA